MDIRCELISGALVDVIKEQIVCIFEKYNINAGTRHDFG